jgi:hypothetical protein
MSREYIVTLLLEQVESSYQARASHLGSLSAQWERWVSLALAEARVARPAMSCVRICFVEGGEYGMLTEG